MGVGVAMAIERRRRRPWLIRVTGGYQEQRMAVAPRVTDDGRATSYSLRLTGNKVRVRIFPDPDRTPMVHTVTRPNYGNWL